MLALSIRQPFAELILRGLKTVEYRSRPTKIIGQRFYIYASKGKQRTASARPPGPAVTSDNLSVATPPPWMLDLAKALTLFGPDGGGLDTGLIVGSAVIEKVTPPDTGFGTDGLFRWHLVDVERIDSPHKPKGHPQPVWWRPG